MPDMYYTRRAQKGEVSSGFGTGYWGCGSARSCSKSKYTVTRVVCECKCSLHIYADTRVTTVNFDVSSTYSSGVQIRKMNSQPS